MITHVEKTLASREINQDYRDGWDAIWGKKDEEPKKKLPPEPGRIPDMGAPPEDEIIRPIDKELLKAKRNPDLHMGRAVHGVLHNSENSKKAKVARGEALTQKPVSSRFVNIDSGKGTPNWGDPTIDME